MQELNLLIVTTSICARFFRKYFLDIDHVKFISASSSSYIMPVIPGYSR